ncbi:hypothetical protein Zmor_022631 [Zophobas morio]|uniref:Inorganic phosphate cotransporter n=1 Tax=Zophobas morio TaxID=2755281 RepID=A0AA38M6L2_9CUCU|nr:hypothetical protein Zmor_022631 [Zophobas morio]
MTWIILVVPFDELTESVPGTIANNIINGNLRFLLLGGSIYHGKAYVWGYLITPLLSGLVSDKKGGKYFVSIPILVISVIKVITPPMLSGSDSDFYILFTWYFLIGAGAAMVACGINSILAHWTPVEERGRLGSLAYCGTQFAVTFHSEIPDNFILATNLWNTPFYIYSALGLIWSVSFLFLGSSHYHIRKHGMHQSELQYLQDKLQHIKDFNRQRVPWLKIATSAPLWALIIINMGHIWIWTAMITNLPFYLRYVLFFSNEKTMGYACLAYMSLSCCTLMCGFFSDFLTSRKYIQTRTLRKVYTTFGAMGPAVFLLTAAYTGCHRTEAVFMFVIGMSFMGFYFGGTKINTLEIAPNFSGTVIGLVNMFESVPLLVLPIVERIVSPTNVLHEKKLLFWIHLAVLAVTNMFFTLFGSVDVQSWDSEEVEEEQEMEHFYTYPTATLAPRPSD